MSLSNTGNQKWHLHVFCWQWKWKKQENGWVAVYYCCVGKKPGSSVSLASVKRISIISSQHVWTFIIIKNLLKFCVVLLIDRMELSPFLAHSWLFILQSSTLEYYTGYTEKDISGLVQELNAMIASPPKQLTTIRSKYSHRWVVHCRTLEVAMEFGGVLLYVTNISSLNALYWLKLDFNSFIKLMSWNPMHKLI